MTQNPKAVPGEIRGKVVVEVLGSQHEEVRHALAVMHVRYGYRRLTVLLRRAQS